MRRHWNWIGTLAGMGLALAAVTGAERAKPRTTAGSVTAGALRAIGPDGGACPLKHTAVRAAISGPLARVDVIQQFENPYPDTIEAVYLFPLPHRAAVDRMTMRVGGRTVRGVIKRREEAQAIYERARQAGHTASLLDQERPNVFTQAVANIRPGEQVRIEISYVETLPYDDGVYEFSFPMVVGPRYHPRQISGAARVTPPVTPEGMRAGHDVSLEVTIEAGVPIQFLRSLTHEIDTERPDPRRTTVRLRQQAAIPNKDFVLQYDVSGARLADALLVHRGPRGGFFTFLLQPPDQPRAAEISPKEIVFVLDTSGSMMGFPIEKAKEAMKLALDGLHPRDTFNLITFAGDTHLLFPQPVAATAENLALAQKFLADRRGSGGTEMMKAIRAALAPSGAEGRVRVVCFMTDGYVGNDMEILGEIQRHPHARVFAFGIGSAVNRFLLDGMARAGRGEVEYVGLEDDGSLAARRFHERVRSPLLTDLEIDWNGLPVSEVYPARIPDLFSARPVVVTGRYSAPARGTLRLRGKMAGRPYMREIPVVLPPAEPAHDVAATLWARHKIEELMASDWQGMQHGQPADDLRERITQIGLEFGVMTQFTSFVAVEDRIVTEGGQPRRVEVPVEMPQGVSYEGVFGQNRAEAGSAARYKAPGLAGGVIGGSAPLPSSARVSAAVPPLPPLSARLSEGAGNEGTGLTAAASTRKIDPGLLRQTGAIEVKIYLTGASAETLGHLKELGLEAITILQPGRLVTGRIVSAKLAALARLAEVRYIAPR